MNEAFFEQFPASHLIGLLIVPALALPALGLVVGMTVGRNQRRVAARWILAGLLGGVSALLLMLGWDLVEARTGFHDRLYAATSKGRSLFQEPLPPAEHYERQNRARHKATDPILRSASPDVRTPSETPPAASWWWALIPPDRLDSVGNIVLLGIVFALAGLGLGRVWGWALRRWPRVGEGGEA